MLYGYHTIPSQCLSHCCDVRNERTLVLSAWPMNYKLFFDLTWVSYWRQNLRRGLQEDRSLLLTPGNKRRGTGKSETRKEGKKLPKAELQSWLPRKTTAQICWVLCQNHRELACPRQARSVYALGHAPNCWRTAPRANSFLPSFECFLVAVPEWKARHSVTYSRVLSSCTEQPGGASGCAQCILCLVSSCHPAVQHPLVLISKTGHKVLIFTD
jgi:hypothetical protein